MSGNGFGGSVRDFLYTLSHVSLYLNSVLARGCGMQGMVSRAGFEESFMNPGSVDCTNVEINANVFPVLNVLDLSHNFIEKLKATPRPWLAFGAFHHNNITEIHPAWWN